MLNKLAITSAGEMDDTELALLDELYENVLSTVTQDQQLTIAEVLEWHRKWLGNIYDWAGQERSVNMSKDGFHFAAAGQITYCLKELEKNYLSALTPCHLMNELELVDAIAKVHVELILIHPFREGNGRI